MAFLQLDNFLCWKLKVATLVICIYVCVVATVASLLELLDIIAWDPSGNFEIKGGFESSWRAHAWEGWLACSILMFIAHLIAIFMSSLLIVAIKIFPTYYEFNITKWYLGIFVCYILIELGTQLYKYSYYAYNTFVVGVIIVYSRIAEVAYEIKFGEKRDLSGWTSKANLLDITGYRSGAVTPSVRK
ncbi:hypothetical protein HELRODRAFT_179732 [Helobdella robusta]|uniref:Uncharacterized protein n=1 Tax=Helobdella robusta TaxID=6412 RepID=T1FF32_HELRO|nr:hypothetical protein HELRODRAFT_179732 [Helobdella robusta]ESN95136.1 hypothetical protein HELRODRAFT_179732 [Helobdella robusta]